MSSIREELERRARRSLAPLAGAAACWCRTGNRTPRRPSRVRVRVAVGWSWLPSRVGTAPPGGSALTSHSHTDAPRLVLRIGPGRMLAAVVPDASFSARIVRFRHTQHAPRATSAFLHSARPGHQYLGPCQAAKGCSPGIMLPRSHACQESCFPGIMQSRAAWERGSTRRAYEDQLKYASPARSLAQIGVSCAQRSSASSPWSSYGRESSVCSSLTME